MRTRERCTAQLLREFNIVVLGPGGVGKSCLITQFVLHIWIDSYDPIIEDSFRKQVSVDGRQAIIEILDTAGTEQYIAMRDLYIKMGQGFLLVFSITSQSSLAELAALREEIIRIKDDENIPIVIVGNKADLEEHRLVPRTKAFSVSQRWGAPYYETSAKTSTNVDEAFMDLCRRMLCRDDTCDSQEGDDYDAWRPNHGGKRRRRKGRKERPCVIL